MTLAAVTIAFRGEFRADQVFVAALMWMSWAAVVGKARKGDAWAS
jgi:hypothetical protein